MILQMEPSSQEELIAQETIVVMTSETITVMTAHIH